MKLKMKHVKRWCPWRRVPQTPEQNVQLKSLIGGSVWMADEGSIMLRGLGSAKAWLHMSNILGNPGSFIPYVELEDMKLQVHYLRL
jgi:hypothetical protein